MTAKYTHKTLHTVHTHGKVYLPCTPIQLNAAEAAELESLDAVARLSEDEIDEIEAREEIAKRRAAGADVDDLLTQTPEQIAAAKKAAAEAKKAAAAAKKAEKGAEKGAESTEGAPDGKPDDDGFGDD